MAGSGRSVADDRGGPDRSYDLRVTTIDPTTHAELIVLQRASNAAQNALQSYLPDVRGSDETEEQRAERRRLRAAAVEASSVKERALQESGLPAEHGYHQVNIDLRNAARDHS